MFKKNIVYTSIFVFVNMFSALLLTRINLDYLGMEKFGVWIFFCQIVVLGTFVEHIISIPIVQIVSANKESSYKELEKYITKLSLITVSVIYFFLCFTIEIVSGLFERYEINSLLIFLGYLIIVFQVKTSITASVICGSGENYKVQFIKTIARIMHVILSIILVSHFQILGLTISLLFYYLFQMYYLNLVNILNNNKSLVFKTEFNRMIKDTALARFLAFFTEPSLKFYIGSNINPESLGKFEIAQRANVAFTSLPIFVLTNIVYRVNQLTNGEKIYNSEVKKLRMTAYILVAIVMMLCIFISQSYGDYIFQVFLGKSNNDVVEIFQLFILAYTINTLCHIDLYILSGYGYTEIQRYSSIFIFVLTFLFLLFNYLFLNNFLSLLSLTKGYLSIIAISSFLIIIYSHIKIVKMKFI